MEGAEIAFLRLFGRRQNDSLAFGKLTEGVIHQIIKIRGIVRLVFLGADVAEDHIVISRNVKYLAVRCTARNTGVKLLSDVEKILLRQGTGFVPVRIVRNVIPTDNSYVRKAEFFGRETLRLDERGAKRRGIIQHGLLVVNVGEAKGG